MDYTKQFLSAFQYSVSRRPTTLPVTLESVKVHLRLDPSDISQDAELTRFISAATAYCEKYTRRTLITTGFLTYRNFFSNTIDLRRSPFKDLVTFKYTVNDALTDVDSSLYYIGKNSYYNKVYLRNDLEYPDDSDEILDAIQIDFNAGYADDEPGFIECCPDLYLAILNHIAALYENRGDCDMASVSRSLPNTSRMIYDLYRILELV